jgi:F0F1-type ATP synthase membrane subunit c/vacuolar-type H+-ATPase subunit K
MAFIAPLLPALSVIGAGIGAVGQIQSGMYQGQVADNNAKIAAQNAEYARESGQQQAAVTSMKGASKVAHVKAAQAASGIDVNTGSAADVTTGEREVAKLDVDTVLNNAELQAYGYTTQQASFKAQAQQDRTAAIIGATGDLFSAASSLDFKWGQPTGTTNTAKVRPGWVPAENAFG